MSVKAVRKTLMKLTPVIEVYFPQKVANRSQKGEHRMLRKAASYNIATWQLAYFSPLYNSYLVFL